MTDLFSPDYFTARARFRSGVLACGGQIESILLNANGPAGEDLTIDIGWFGCSSPQRAFIHSSGLHGVEGFAGSAIQLQWLEGGIPQLAADSAIALVHGLNPFGMAWLRRVNENNVDLNRNFLDTEEEFAGTPKDYAALDSFLNPASLPLAPAALDFFPVRAALMIFRYGMPALRQAIACGQYEFPRGLFFGGQRHEQGPRRFQVYLSSRLAASERLVGIDVHTGLGPFGEDHLLVNGDRERAASIVQMRAAYGHRVRALESSAGIAYRTRGAQDGLYFRMFPGAQVLFAVQEFGTRHPVKVLAALRDENRRHHYGAAGDEQLARARAQLREVFCPSGRKWRERILRRGKEVIAQGLSLAFD